MSEIFSKNLIKYRRSRGYSQRDLAEKTGLTQRVVNYYENNPASIPIKKLKKITKVLKIKISDLFSETMTSTNASNFDIRWIKKIQKIQKLSDEEQKEINRHINYLYERSTTKSPKKNA